MAREERRDDRDEYGIYRKPTGSVIAAWLGIAAAIFFGAYAFKVKDKLQATQEELQKVRDELSETKEQRDSGLSELQALKTQIQLRGGLAVQPGGIPVAVVPAPAALQVVPVSAGAAGIPAELPAAPTAVVAAAAGPAAMTAGRGTDAVAAAPAGGAAAGRLEAGRETPVVAKPETVAAAHTSDAADGSQKRQETLTLPAASGAAGGEKAELNDAARLSGEILNYNPDTRKAILSLGSATSGLQAGSRFSVWRGETYVTDIRVVTVYSVTSTCEVEGPTPIGVRAGDIAKLAVKPSGT